MIIAKRKMSNFSSFEDLAEWLSKYRVYSVYGKQVMDCWNALQNYESTEHKLDYRLCVHSNMFGKHFLRIDRFIRENK